MNKKAFFISLAITALIGYFILTPPSFFNFLPFAIHENLLRNTAIYEHHFIIAFDLTFLAIFLFTLNSFLKRIMK